MSTPQGIDHMKRTFEKLLRSKGITGDERLICYEDSLRGMFGASCRGWYLLRTLGHPNVQVLDGGWQKWTREERPTFRGGEEHKQSMFTVRFDDSEWTDIEVVKWIESSSAGSAKLLDVRDRAEWDGSSSSPDGTHFAPRRGRLPSAAWIEWYDFMEECKGNDNERDDEDSDSDEDTEKFDVSTFKQPEEILRIMNDKGFHVNDNIVLYCFKGARAANTLLAHRAAGFHSVSIYFGSWNEWSRDVKLPIEDAESDGRTVEHWLAPGLNEMRPIEFARV
jgi:thiosulfate/3-mercaptopyruvate sulfurtransferase